MTGAERLDTIKHLVDRATEVSTAVRPQFVRGACDGDSSMAAEVLSLLAHDTGTPPWPEAPLVEPPAPDESALEPGQSLGPYRVERRLGEGGMGLVALASRAQDFEKQVALKVIRGPLTETSIRRFERERQILANLEHPGIARLLDGGRLDDGRPWLAMEYVDGVAIDRYCDDHALDICNRIALVVKVCEALDAAHRLQVVHRDIKPSNLLVTADGRPRLLDFGIAKQLEDGVTDPSEPTGPSGQPMTLRWAAPEQITCGPITAATDVHGLGLLLYRLLTGRHAFAGATRAELAVAISERVPIRPSGVVEDPTRSRELRGDLDAIVGKALSKHPADRYASAGELGEDLRRYLAGLPVRARAFSGPRWAERFLRRNWFAVAALLLMCLGVVFGVVATLSQASAEQAKASAEQDRKEALLASERSERALRFVSSLLWDLQPADDRRLAIEVLREAESNVDDFADPELAANVMDVVGRTYAEWGDLEAALKSWARSLEHLQDLYPASEYPDGHPRIAVAMNNLASGYFLLRSYQEAVSLYERALEMKESFGENLSGLSVALSMANLATAKMRLGDLDTVEHLYRTSLLLRKQIAEPDPGGIGKSYRGLAVYYLEAGHPAKSEEASRRALTYLLQASQGRENTRIASTRTGMARAIHDQGRVAEALPLYEQAMATRRETFGDDHLHVTSSHLDLARALIDLQRFEEASEHLARARNWLDAQPAHRYEAYRARSEVLAGVLDMRQGRCDGSTGEMLRDGFEQLAEGRERLDHYGRRAKAWLSEYATTCGPVQMASIGS